MLDGSLDQGSLICLGYAYFFSIPEPEYKRYAYKKKHVYAKRNENTLLKIYLSKLKPTHHYMFAVTTLH